MFWDSQKDYKIYVLLLRNTNTTFCKSQQNTTIKDSYQIIFKS